jgi:hypothetical protein
MPSEMRRPSTIEIPEFTRDLDILLRNQVPEQRRAILPTGVQTFARRLSVLVKPLLQSGAMALTALAVIIAVSAVPAATTGLSTPTAGPLAAPNPYALIESDSNFVDYLPNDDLLAIQEADNSDIDPSLAE